MLSLSVCLEENVHKFNEMENRYKNILRQNEGMNND